MNPVVHFEMPYKNAERIQAFYTQCFGWKVQALGENSGNYVLATTAIQDAKPGFPAGAINGGFFPYKEDWPNQYPSIVIGVENLNETMQKIQAAGGSIVGTPLNIPNFGLYVSFMDTEGNRNSLIQPSGM